jgi:hypothetical protein
MVHLEFASVEDEEDGIVTPVITCLNVNEEVNSNETPSQ